MDKLKKIWGNDFFLSPALKDGEKIHNAGRLGLLMSFLVALYSLILRRPNLEVATKRFLDRLIKILR